MSEGFLDLANMNSFFSKTMLLPLDRQRCLGRWEKRKDGLDYC